MIAGLAILIPPAIPIVTPIPAMNWSCTAWDANGRRSRVHGRFDPIEASAERPIYSPHRTHGTVERDTAGELKGEYLTTYEGGGYYRMGDGRNFLSIDIKGAEPVNLLKIESYHRENGMTGARVGFCRVDKDSSPSEKK